MQLQCKETEKHDKSGWHISRNAHQNAFETLIQYIQDEIVEKKEVHYPADINKYYESLLQELLRNLESQYNVTKLEDKIVNHFQEKIKILKGKTIRGNINYSSHFSLEEVLCLADKKNIKLEMREAALNLRNAIKDADVACFSKELTVEDIYKGEADIPDLLKTFITYLISGPDIKR